jgi:hypothetical protein
LPLPSSLTTITTEFLFCTTICNLLVRITNVFLIVLNHICTLNSSCCWITIAITTISLHFYMWYSLLFSPILRFYYTFWRILGLFVFLLNFILIRWFWKLFLLLKRKLRFVKRSFLLICFYASRRVWVC